MGFGAQDSEMPTMTLANAPNSKPTILTSIGQGQQPPKRAVFIGVTPDQEIVDMVATVSPTTEPSLTTLDSITSATTFPTGASVDDNKTVIIIGSVFGGILVIGLTTFGCIVPLFRRWRDNRTREREMRHFQYITLYAAATDPALREREGPRVTVRETDEHGVELQSLEGGRRNPVGGTSSAATVQGAGLAPNEDEEGAQAYAFSHASSRTYVGTANESPQDTITQHDSAAGDDTAGPVPGNTSTEGRARAGYSGLAAAQLDGDASGYDEMPAEEGDGGAGATTATAVTNAIDPLVMSRHLTNVWMEYAKKLERRLTKLRGDFHELRTEVNAWEIRQAELGRNINRLKQQIEMLMDIHGMDIDMPSTRSRASSL